MSDSSNAGRTNPVKLHSYRKAIANGLYAPSEMDGWMDEIHFKKGQLQVLV